MVIVLLIPRPLSLGYLYYIIIWGTIIILVIDIFFTLLVANVIELNLVFLLVFKYPVSTSILNTTRLKKTQNVHSICLHDFRIEYVLCLWLILGCHLLP